MFRGATFDYRRILTRRIHYLGATTSVSVAMIEECLRICFGIAARSLLSPACKSEVSINAQSEHQGLRDSRAYKACLLFTANEIRR